MSIQGRLQICCKLRKGKTASIRRKQKIAAMNSYLEEVILAGNLMLSASAIWWLN